MIQSQSFSFHDEAFHRIRFSSFHCLNIAGGQRLSFEVSSTSGLATMRKGVARRRCWRVASLIRSTYSGLLAIRRVLAKSSRRRSVGAGD
ncbi:hypothetical protein BJA5080_01562 [Bradyrhizobium diazoefficiens SEMIA 5080]|uniref:Uncharacterized protein n=1 Tax=Bradyrhizobium diazoefficiens SEMIA 5080 TaxID=754504 RepID=A0A837C6R1_9BRAD|nr:hypothetical protein BJA5080_01562 [Bradyrhizobium diazoefficiens SEMIA 5080]